MVRVVFFVLMAFGLVGFGMVAWVISRPPPQPQAVVPPPPTMVTVMTAAHPITAGSLLKPEDVGPSAVPANAANIGDSMPDTAESRRMLVGAMARRALAAGDVVREGDVIRPGEHGFLAAALMPGMRAVTITVDTGTGAGDLIGPGDRVDVILTQTLSDPSLPASRRVAAETVLSDVRVIAMDQKLVLGAATTAPDRGNRTVTLEVSEGQAQRISVATQLGRLSLSVRAAEAAPAGAVSTGAGKDIAAAPAKGGSGTVWASDVSPALGATEGAPPTAGTSIKVYPGGGEAKEFKF